MSINLSNSRIIELETVKTAIEFAILLSLPEYLFLRSTPCPPNPVLRETVQVTKQHPDFIWPRLSSLFASFYADRARKKKAKPALVTAPLNNKSHPALLRTCVRYGAKWPKQLPRDGAARGKEIWYAIIFDSFLRAPADFLEDLRITPTTDCAWKETGPTGRTGHGGDSSPGCYRSVASEATAAGYYHHQSSGAVPPLRCCYCVVVPEAWDMGKMQRLLIGRRCDSVS